jgi:hypothetical protein
MIEIITYKFYMEYYLSVDSDNNDDDENFLSYVEQI